MTSVRTSPIFLSSEAKVALKDILERNRLEQTETAAAVGVSRISVGNWVHGRGVPSGFNLVRLLTYLRQFEPDLQAEDLLSAAPEADPEPVSGAA